MKFSNLLFVFHFITAFLPFCLSVCLSVSLSLSLSPKKNKTKKNKKSSMAKDKTNSEQIEDTDVVELTSPGTSNERKSTIIIGNSIITKTSGCKMTHKSNKIIARAFSGSKVEDMTDYMKPTLNTRPDNVILHTSTNNVRFEEPQVVAEKIVKIYEQIEGKSPDTKITLSELTARQDSTELGQKRVAINKILCSFSKSRNRKFISHDNIDPSWLNGRKLHLNVRGTINLAKKLKN